MLIDRYQRKMNFMKNVLNAFKQLLKKRNSNILKIVLLAFGMAMGLVLIAKIYFEQSYDSYVTDGDRVYSIYSNYTSNGETKDWAQTPGAIAPGIKAYSPAVEVATRYTFLDGDINLLYFDNAGNEKGKIFTEFIILADSNFFKIFDRKVYAGNPEKILQMPQYVLVSESFAAKIAPNKKNVVGISISLENRQDVKVTIGGVFQDFPKNSQLKDCDVIVSLNTIGKYMGDGSNNWLGNDRYKSFVKLYEGQKPELVKDGINKMCEQNLPQEELKKAGVGITFSIKPLEDAHRTNPDVKRMCGILLILSLIVIFAASLNYVLIAISEMVHKSKMVAVHKCYGATSHNVYNILLSEAFVNILVSLLLAVLILFGFRELVEKLLGTTLISLIANKSIYILGAVCLLVFLVCGVIPGVVYSKIPVATAFRRYKENTRFWKLLLLFVQFIGSSFFIAMLLVVMLQYNHVLNASPGYDYKKLAYLDLSGVDRSKFDLLKQEFSKLPFIEQQSMSSGLPFQKASGNNIRLKDDVREIMNVSDLYCVSEGYFKMMGVPIVEGENFNEDNPAEPQIMVSESTAKKLVELVGWKDGVIGKQIQLTEHGRSGYTICGVYKDFLLGTYSDAMMRPSVQFFYKSELENGMVRGMVCYLLKLREITPENLSAISAIVSKVVTEKDVNLRLYDTEYKALYAESRNFRDTVLIAGLVVFLITLIGLVGYARDEINRRRSELSIRKIHGASLSSLLKLFVRNIMVMAAPAVLIGVVLAYFVADMWIELYSDKIALSWWIFASCGLLTLTSGLVVVLVSTFKAANTNPIENLKSE